VLLIVDDANLADEATIEACEQLARGHGEPPVLTALAYRRSLPRRRWPAPWPARPGGPLHHGRARPLAEAEIVALVRASADPGRVSRIVAMPRAPVLRARTRPRYRDAVVGLGRDHRPRASTSTS